MVEQILADNEHHRARAGVDRHQDAPRTTMIAELHWMGNIADADVTLRRCNDLTRLDAAAALNQFAVEARVLEVSDPIRDEVRLIHGDRDRIDRATDLVFGSRPSRGQ